VFFGDPVGHGNPPNVYGMAARKQREATEPGA